MYSFYYWFGVFSFSVILALIGSLIGKFLVYLIRNR